MVRPQDETTVFKVEELFIPKTEKGEAGPQLDQVLIVLSDQDSLSLSTFVAFFQADEEQILHQGFEASEEGRVAKVTGSVVHETQNFLIRPRNFAAIKDIVLVNTSASNFVLFFLLFDFRRTELNF